MIYENPVDALKSAGAGHLCISYCVHGNNNTVVLHEVGFINSIVEKSETELPYIKFYRTCDIEPVKIPIISIVMIQNSFIPVFRTLYKSPHFTPEVFSVFSDPSGVPGYNHGVKGADGRVVLVNMTEEDANVAADYFSIKSLRDPRIQPDNLPV